MNILNDKELMKLYGGAHLIGNNFGKSVVLGTTFLRGGTVTGKQFGPLVAQAAGALPH